MLSPVIQRLGALLCLVASLWMGLGPAQAFVLCCEPDGSVSLEVAVGVRCGGCPAACEAHEPATPSCEDGGSACADGACRTTADAGNGVSTHASRCPCIDIVLPSADGDRLQPKSVQPEIGKLIALAPAIGAAWLRPPFSLPAPQSLACSERPPPVLALLRSVVLIV